MIRKSTALAAAVLAVGTYAAPATAAPPSTLGGGKDAVESNVEKAHYRRCWYSHGVRRCRIVRAYRYYDGPYYDYAPGYYYGPGFYGPSFGFSFGGFGHHHHHHHR
jgi:hypothetical protein